MSASFQHAALLQSLKQQFKARPSASFLIPLLVSTACGRSHEWLPHIYQSAVANLPESSAGSTSRTAAPALPSQDTNARRRIVREMKESLIKASILIGVPRVIEALLELGELLPDSDKSDASVRSGMEADSIANVGAHGEKGLRRIYRDDIQGIWQRMEPDMRDVRFISQHVTYGIFLTPHEGVDASESPDPLAYDPALLSVVTLSCLIPQRCPREILWHLRGALRNGLSRPEAQELQDTIELVCEKCGLHDVGHQMPRVGDVPAETAE